jgi:hypothetical protein
MTQTGLNDDYLVVSWFGNFTKEKKSFDNEFHLANTDSWFEVYKLTKEQWKSEIMAQEQVIRFRV